MVNSSEYLFLIPQFNIDSCHPYLITVLCRSAISHSIREQVYVHFKSLLIGQEYDGNYLSERVKNQLMPSLKSLLRDPPMAEKFTPVLLEISDLELDRIEREKLREFR